VARKTKTPPPGKWQHQVENLTAYERGDRNMDIYTRVLLDGGKYGHKQRLCGSIRDGAGKIIPDREAAAVRLAVDRQSRIASGLADTRDGPLTLATAFRRLLHDREGKYAGETARKRDVERYSKTVIRVLGGDLLATDIRHGHYRKLWRHLAHVNAKDAGKYGPAAAEKIVGALRTLVAWLQAEELVEPGTGLPAATWKATMRNEWASITDRPVRPPTKHRYTRAEQERLWAALPKADPRLEIAVQLGAELRLGQVARSRRSDVEAFGGFAIGRVRVHGSGRKGGAAPILTPDARRALTRAMTRGVLADLEAAYRAGEIADYYLIPGGKLRTVRTLKGPRKRARVKNGAEHWGRTGMRRAWATLEQLAGVEGRRWRKWYGLRRLSTDLAEDVEQDDRALNEIGGWGDTATRRGYQEQGRTEVAERALNVRRQIRPKAKRDNEIQRKEGGK